MTLKLKHVIKIPTLVIITCNYMDSIIATYVLRVLKYLQTVSVH